MGPTKNCIRHEIFSILFPGMSSRGIFDGKLDTAFGAPLASVTNGNGQTHFYLQVNAEIIVDADFWRNKFV